MLVAGRYTVEAVQSQVILQGPANREIWLAVDPRRRKGREKVTGWMQSSELQRRAACNANWLARLRSEQCQGRLECGGSQLGMQWQPSSNMAWVERSSGGVVPASASGG